MEQVQDQDERKQCCRCGGQGHHSHECHWPVDERDLPLPDLRSREAPARQEDARE